MIIGIDIDNTINNLCEALLEVYNFDTMESIKITDIKSYYIENYVNPEHKNMIIKLFTDSRVWKRIKLIDNCQFCINNLIEQGHRIVFVSASDFINIPKKYEWLVRNFPLIDMRNNFIVAHDKQLVAGLDVLIDDYEKNLIGGIYHKILLDYPWNKNVNCEREGIVRCRDWQEIYNEICRIERERYEVN